jgi:hypothetical protein
MTKEADTDITYPPEKPYQKLYGVYLGIRNGVEAWAIHSLFDNKEGFFVESSPSLMSHEQAKRILSLVEKSAFNLEGQPAEIRLMFEMLIVQSLPHQAEYVAIYNSEDPYNSGWFGYNQSLRYRLFGIGPMFGIFPTPQLIRVEDAEMLLTGHRAFPRLFAGITTTCTLQT